MNYLNVQCSFYCGVDLHSVSMLVCILRSDGTVVIKKRLSNRINLFLELIRPYQHSIAVALESTFNWYWFVDGCRNAGVNVNIGHSYYMQAISKDKNKNDSIDAFKIAQLLRAGLFPKAHACSQEKRPIRDLLRQRNKLQHIRSMFLTSTKEILYQNGIIDLKKDALNSKRTRYSSLELLENEHTLLSSKSNMNLVTALDNELKTIEQELIRYTDIHYQKQSSLLQEIDGIGPIISMTIMYEVDDISRFRRRQDFTSYCRFAKPFHYSDGKIVGMGNSKCGNPYLKWAFMEIVSNAIGHCPEVGHIHAELKTKYKPLHARAIMANRYCTAVYHMLRDNKPFDLKKFCNIPEVVKPVRTAGIK